MSTFFDKITQLEVLEQERSKLNNKLFSLSSLQHQAQKNCPHSIVIHYDDTRLSELSLQEYYMGKFYCPCCGHQSLTVKRSKEPNSFVLEASGYKNSNTELNLRAAIKEFKAAARKLHDKECYSDPSYNAAEELAKLLLQNSRLAFYRMQVSEW